MNRTACTLAFAILAGWLAAMTIATGILALATLGAIGHTILFGDLLVLPALVVALGFEGLSVAAGILAVDWAWSRALPYRNEPSPGTR